MSDLYDVLDDPVIQALVAEAAADTDVIGVVLTGSRAIGVATNESDYDLEFIVTDAALDRYTATGSHPVRGSTIAPPLPVLDIWHEAPRNLSPGTVVAWMLPAWAESQVIYDRAGETTALIDALRRMPQDQVPEMVAGRYDGYLNGLYRSLKQWRRGNVIGARLEAAQNIDALIHLLFALEGRWRPYSSRLHLHLDELAPQGWQLDELRKTLLDLVATGAPHQQQDLARRVIRLLADRGFGHVYDSWDGKIDTVLSWTFGPVTSPD